MSQVIKQQLRNKYLQLLKNIDSIDHKKWDKEIYHQFINSKYFADYQVFALYYSLPYEVDTIQIITDLLKAQKKVVLPRMVEDQIKFYYINRLTDLVVDNQWKIHQPKIGCKYANPSDIDIIVLPLIGFNSDYYRIGHGKGYYDQFLINKNLKVIKLVLAYRVQKIIGKKNFIDSWDIPFDVLITNH